MHVPIINLDPSEATMHQAILKMCNVHRVLIHFADTACRCTVHVIYLWDSQLHGVV